MKLPESLGMNRVVLALSAARLGDAIGNSLLFIVIPLYVAELPAPWFHVPESVRVGILISLYGIVNSVLQPVMGSLSDRFQRRKIFILAGLFVMALSTFLFIFASRFVDLLLLRAIQGVGVAITIPASMALMTSATHKSSRGGSMGIYSTMRIVGFATGPLIGGFLHVRYGFDAAFLAGTGFILLGMILVQFWVHDVATENGVRAGRPRTTFRLFGRGVLSGGVISLGAATFVMATMLTMMSTLEVQFNERLDQTAFAFSVAFSALMVSRLVFQIPLGQLSDRVGRKPLIIFGLLLMAPSTALLGLVASTLQLTGLRLVQGLASAGIAAPSFALAADLSPAGNEGLQMSVITMGFGLGIAVGPLIAGILALVSFQLPFYIGGVLSLVAAWIVHHNVPESIHTNKEPLVQR
ncbi:MAG TPA: MFS transporter [Candidatus Krumholzibacteria bacterium]|nr:MFS transporter [Candidatus Krumholzibacteria bacterium]